tara:strand:- start:997 stop:2049 length:1053 start_codon:yes stop_codon:yes gene_type:complete
MKILVTGSAGFIGFHLTMKLISEKHDVVGLDNINDYYSKDLKYARLNEKGLNKTDISYNKLIISSLYSNYSFIKLDLTDKANILSFFETQKFDVVVNLAAQAGVRYSIENPNAYTDSNITGFMNVLEGSRHSNIGHLIYASTSSVYGLNSKMPLNTNDSTEHPMTIYAATKKANEMMAHSYSHLYNLPTTGLRFFTVYGPWGRPDMALFLFIEAMMSNKPINIFNNGNMVRDFTYVDDIAESVSRLCKKPPTKNPNWNSTDPNPSSSSAPYKIFNIGNSDPINLMDYIDALESALDMKAMKNYMPIQLGDVPKTHADSLELQKWIGFKPQTSVINGVEDFVKWYLDYFKN